MVNQTIKYRCYISNRTYSARVTKRIDERILQVRLLTEDGELTDWPFRYIDKNQIIEQNDE